MSELKFTLLNDHTGCGPHREVCNSMEEVDFSSFAQSLGGQLHLFLPVFSECVC